MSDINDDLLNYELGDIDDHDVNIGDEDDLLLSDEETQQREDALLLDDDELLDGHNPANKNEEEPSPTCSDSKKSENTEIVTTSTTNNNNNNSNNDTNERDVLANTATNKADSSSTEITKPLIDAEVSTTNKQVKSTRPPLKRNPIASSINVKNDEVSSTNKEGDLKGQNQQPPDNSTIEKNTISSNVPQTPTTKENEEKECANVAETVQENEASPQEIVDSSCTSSKKVIYDDDENITQSQQQSAELCDDGSAVDAKREYTEAENSEDENERQNPKTSVERESRESAEFNKQMPRPFYKHRGPPHLNQRPAEHFVSAPFNPYPHPSDSQPHFRPEQPHAMPRPGHIPPQYGPPQPSMNPAIPGSLPPRMEYRNPMPYNYPHQYQSRPIPGAPIQHPHPMRVPRPNEYGPPGQPPVPPQPNGPQIFRPFNGNPVIRNAGVPPPRFEHNMPPRMIGPQQPYMAQRPQQTFIRQPIGPNMGHPPVHGGPPNPNNSGAMIVPMKVLINPNFKGGVEAATNQLMMDTLSKAQFAQSDDELLRKQEAFINQNRLQIERRRYERSPDRSRERSYSPPRRERRAYSREREVRRPHTSYRGGGVGNPNRGKRADSREPPSSQDSRFMPKRQRRSSSLERIDDRRDSKTTEDEEDAETKAYRLEIEKQKSIREKILREKEIRRRKAAEENKKVEDKKSVDESGQKLTPIVVTEKKIISLKKKMDSQQQQQQTTTTMLHTAGQRNIPTAKILPEAKRPIETNTATSTTTLAVVKPVVKQILINKPIYKEPDFDDMEFNEDELLADSPSPSPPPQQQQLQSSQQKVYQISQSDRQTTATTNSMPGMFTNRRVIIKQSSSNIKTPKIVLNSKDVTNEDDGGYNSTAVLQQQTAAATAITTKPKGIFDRLDRRVGVAEVSKRKIQRIVVNNTD